ncbi:MAG: acyltransferase [Muribaculaceae bacterium]|nr:acyltransferase [Muribaculaceae bacterium]
MALLVKEPGFEHAVKYALPDVDFESFAQDLLKIYSKNDFQEKVMVPFLKMLEAKTSKGISYEGISNIDPMKSATFITNHRDIVLDASFLNLVLLRNNIESTEVAIGSNLLIFDWIETLVKINKSFIVKRNVGMRQALDAAIQLSKYIHFTINSKKQSVWIAQREGRAKDSNDVTQESLVKMLSIGGKGNLVDNLLEINLSPVSISYELDPNDYLKAKEFLMKKKNPLHKKSQRDDLFSMETGILQNKGRINFSFAPPINDKLLKIEHPEDKQEALKQVCLIIDNAIHSHYMIYPCNYISYDKLNKVNKFADKYTHEEKLEFENYLNSQLAKVDIQNLSKADREYMMRMMLIMYSNPLVNKLKATNC